MRRLVIVLALLSGCAGTSDAEEFCRKDYDRPGAAPSSLDDLYVECVDKYERQHQQPEDPDRFR